MRQIRAIWAERERQSRVKPHRDQPTPTVTTTRLGEEFGRDHTTVMHSLKKAEEMIRDSRDFSQAAEELKQRLK